MSISPSISVGDVFTNKEGCSYTVVEYNGSHHVKVRFNDDKAFEVTNTSTNVKLGVVKNPFYPTVLGVGFIGDGSHRAKYKGVNDLAYSTWVSMLIRCYSDKGYSRNSSYNDCSVATEWHNFQNFAEWIKTHEHYGLGYQLDKDLLKDGNRVYGPEYCSLIPVEINSLIVRAKPKKNGLPKGVDFYKRKGMFRARISINNKSKEIGFFDSVESARDAYLAEKANYVRFVANQWRGRIKNNAYHSLISREF